MKEKERINSIETQILTVKNMKEEESINSIETHILTVEDMKEKESINDLEATSSAKKKYPRKFNIQWLSDDRFSSWLIPYQKDSKDAYCTLCRRKIAGSVTLIVRHSKTRKHVKKLENSSLSTDLMYQHLLSSKVKVKMDDTVEMAREHHHHHHYSSENDYEVQRPTNIPGEDHNAYFMYNSPEKTHEKLYKETIEAANLLHQTLEARLEDDEFDHFGRSIASQLRKLPEECAVSLISELQCLITQRRLKVMTDRESRVLTVSLEDNPSYSS